MTSLQVSLLVLGFSSLVNAATCQRMSAEAFLSRPTKQTLLVVDKSDDEDCWKVIGAANKNLNRLLRSVESGNQWSATYLVKRLDRLDGGNLEDVMVALGQFGDHNIERLLAFGGRGELSSRQLSEALTMLPLSLSDNPDAQLEAMKARRAKVTLVRRRYLIEQKAIALKAIDEFLNEIASSK